MKTIEVLGTGPSIQQYQDRGNSTIGVNDIFRIRYVDRLLIMDRPDRFSKYQLDVIVNSKPVMFYTDSHVAKLWKPYLKCFFTFKKAKKPADPSTLGNWKRVPYHVDSTYTAVCLAYLLRADTIILNGVDLRDHPDLKHYWKQGVIQKAYGSLQYELNRRGTGLFVGSLDSPLSNILPLYNYG